MLWRTSAFLAGRFCGFLAPIAELLASVDLFLHMQMSRNTNQVYAALSGFYPARKLIKFGEEVAALMPKQRERKVMSGKEKNYRPRFQTKTTESQKRAFECYSAKKNLGTI